MRSLILPATSVAYSQDSAVVDLRRIDQWSVEAVVTVLTGAAKTFVDGDVSVANNTITITSHAMLLGEKVAATTDGTLPAGLSATNYYVIYVDANTIKLATSQANALAGTAVDITAAAGGGTHTLTPATAWSATLKLQASNDNSNWVDIASATATSTSTGACMVNITAAGYRYGKANILATTGLATVSMYAAGKERTASRGC